MSLPEMGLFQEVHGNRGFKGALFMGRCSLAPPGRKFSASLDISI
jgi:hypothetical protein